MKKQKQQRGALTKQVRALEAAVLASASGGADAHDDEAITAYMPQQHNETIVCDRRAVARRGRAGTRVEPYIPHQHNETLVRDRAARR